MTWTERSLGQLCDDGGGTIKTGPFGSQLHQSDYSEAGTPVVMPKDIVAGRVSPNSIARVANEHVNRLAQHQMKVGDIVYGRRGDIGRCALITPQEKNWLCGTGCLRLQLGKAAVTPEFLFYYLNHPDTITWIFNQAIGATMPNLNTGILRSVPIRYPSLPTQRRIASILSVYDDLIENNTRRIAILEEMARRLYEEWFVKFRFPGHGALSLECDQIPNGWVAKRLGDLATEIRDAVHPSKVPGETPYVGLEHIPRRSITLNDWSTAESVSSNKLLFRRGDILFGKIRPYFHKVVIAPIDGVCSTDAIVLRPKQRNYFALVICCASSDAFVKNATQTSNGTKMPRADWKVLKLFPVAVPTNDVLVQFNSSLGPIVEQTRVLMFKNANLRAQRDLLLPKLISGEIDVSNLPLPGSEDHAA